MFNLHLDYEPVEVDSQILYVCKACGDGRRREPHNCKTHNSTNAHKAAVEIFDKEIEVVFRHQSFCHWFDIGGNLALPPPPQAQAQVFPSAGSFTVSSSQVQMSSFDFLAAFK